MNLKINEHFNQTSDKVLAIDELMEKSKEPTDTPEVIQKDREMFEGMAGWKDADEKSYVSEMAIKYTFSIMAAAGPKDEVKAMFTRLQAIMDDCEDHAPKTKPQLRQIQG